MKDYTTIEQSKKLLKLGLSPETANMRYVIKHDIGGRNIGHYPMIGREPSMGTIPCWSLGALLELMPNIRTEHGIIRPKGVKESSKSFPYRYYYETLYFTDMCATPIEAAYDMIVWLLEKNYIKRGE